MNLGIILGKLRNERGIKQIYVAEKSNLSQTQLSHIEKGKRRITDNEFADICTALNLDKKTLIVEIIKQIDQSGIKNGRENDFNLIKDDIAVLLELLLNDLTSDSVESIGD